MNKLNRSIMCTILAGATSLAAGGCWYAVAGAGAYAGYRFVDGEYKGVVKAELDDAVKATRAAFKDLDIREKSFEESEGHATFQGESPSNTDVQVKLEYAGEDATNVRIRIDTFGDKSYSQIVVDKINANL